MTPVLTPMTVTSEDNLIVLIAQARQAIEAHRTVAGHGSRQEADALEHRGRLVDRVVHAPARTSQELAEKAGFLFYEWFTCRYAEGAAPDYPGDGHDHDGADLALWALARDARQLAG